MGACEWVDSGPDMDGTSSDFPCAREATDIFTADDGTAWEFCAKHAAKAKAESEWAS